MFHPLLRCPGGRPLRAGLLFLLLACLAAPGAQANTWAKVKTNLGPVEMIFYTDRPTLAPGNDTAVVTDIRPVLLRQRSGRLGRSIPILSLLFQDPRGLLFHRADAGHVFTGVLRRNGDGEIEAVNQNLEESFVPSTVIGTERGSIVLAYTTVDDRVEEVAPGVYQDLAFMGRGFRVAITTREGGVLDPCPEFTDLLGPVEHLDPDDESSPRADRILQPDRYLCALAVIGHVVRGMDVIDTIAASPQIHGFFGIESASLDGLADPLVHELARLPLLSPIAQPAPNGDGTSIFGCGSVTEPEPGSALDPALDVSSCASWVERTAWIAAQRAVYDAEIDDRLIQVRKVKSRKSVSGAEVFLVPDGVEIQVGRIDRSVQPLQWALRVDGDRWSATDVRGGEYGGRLKHKRRKRYRLRLDAASKQALLETWTRELETQAVAAMQSLAASDQRLPPDERRFPLLDHLRLGITATANVELASRPRLKARIDARGRTVQVFGKANLTGDLVTVVRKFRLGELGSAPESRIRPVDLEVQFRMLGRLGGRLR